MQGSSPPWGIAVIRCGANWTDIVVASRLVTSYPFKWLDVAVGFQLPSKKAEPPALPGGTGLPECSELSAFPVRKVDALVQNAVNCVRRQCLHHQRHYLAANGCPLA